MKKIYLQPQRTMLLDYWPPSVEEDAVPTLHILKNQM